jgi:hypothetical protein
MPSNVSIATTYVANQSLNSFVEASVNLFPYQLPTGSSLYLGLYVNGNLEATQVYRLDQGSGQNASIVSIISANVANFTSSSMGFTVTYVPTSSLPTGTSITVTALATSPVWVQIDDQATTHSYESTTLSASSSLPAQVIPATGTVAPYTLSVGVESSYA